MATTIAVVGALAGAYGAHENAQAANASHNAYTDTTSTQVPYMWQNINPNIENAINYQNLLLQRGAPQVDSHGNVTYAALPGQPGAQGQGAPATASASAGGGGARTGGGGGGKGPSTWVNAKGQTIMVGPGGKAVPAPAGTPAPGAGGGASGPPAYNSAQSILPEVAQRGFDAGNTPTIAGARNVMANMWGDSGNADGAGGTEQTGFERYNPILDNLARTVGGNMQGDNGQARDLLLGFLGQGGNGASGGGGAAYAPGTPGTSAGGAIYVAGNNRSYPSATGGGSVPDTMKGSSFFADQTKKMFDDPTNNADIQTMIDAMNADAQRGMYADKASLDAAAQGTGRLGGDTWKGLSNDAERTANTAMLNNAATVRVGQRNQTMQQRLAALGLVNQRDLGLLDANTSMSNAATAASASGAGSAAAADVARRGQNLEAINSLLSNEQYNQNQYGQLGSQLSGDRLSSLGMVPGLEGVGLSGLNESLGAAGQYTTMHGQDLGLREAQIGAGVQRQALNQQLGLANASAAQGSVNDYLNTMLRIGGMGGTSTTNGVNVQPGAGVSPTGSAVMGGIGGAAAASGAYNQYRNAGG